MATQTEAVNWLVSKLGTYLDYDGAWGSQCVDSFNYYYQFLVGASPYDHGYGVNGAKDLWNVATDRFTKIPDSASLVPQAGDILIYGSTWGSGYGHVEMVRYSNATGAGIIGTNLHGNPSANVSEQFRTWAQMRGLIGVMRFNGFTTAVTKGDESMAIKNPEFIKNMYRYVGGREATQADVDAHMKGTPESLLNGFIGGNDVAVVHLRKTITDLQTALVNEQSKPPKEVVKIVTEIVKEYVDRPVEVIKEVEPGWLTAVVAFIRKVLHIQ